MHKNVELLTLNICLMSAATIIGAGVSLLLKASFSVPVPHPTPTSAMLKDFLTISANNLLVIAVMAVGALLFGTITVVVVVFNGFRIGYDMSALLGNAPAQIVYLVPYLPLEAFGLCVAAAGCEALGLDLFYYLFENQAPRRLMSSMLAIIRASGLIIVAAAIEAIAKYARDNVWLA